MALMQELESVLVGPVELGLNRFVFQVPPPRHSFFISRTHFEECCEGVE